MAKKKKEPKPVEMYAIAGMGDNLIRIAWKNNLNFADLKALNPDIKGPGFMCRMGQRVRIK